MGVGAGTRGIRSGACDVCAADIGVSGEASEQAGGHVNPGSWERSGRGYKSGCQQHIDGVSGRGVNQGPGGQVHREKGGWVLAEKMEPMTEAEESAGGGGQQQDP